MFFGYCPFCLLCNKMSWVYSQNFLNLVKKNFAATLTVHEEICKNFITDFLWPLWAKRNIPAINFTKAALFSKRYLSVMPYKYSGFFHPQKWFSLYLGCPASLLHQAPTERYSSMGWSLTSVNKVWRLESHWLWGNVSGVLKRNTYSSAFFLQETKSLTHGIPPMLLLLCLNTRSGQVFLSSHKHCLWKCDWVKLCTLDVKTLPSCCKWKGQEWVLLVCG